MKKKLLFIVLIFFTIALCSYYYLQSKDDDNNLNIEHNSTADNTMADLSISNFFMLFSNKYHDLQVYSYSSGGNMNGNSYVETISKINSQYILSISSAEWYFQPPKVTEYIVDKAILNDIEKVFSKHHMERWKNKKFTDMFIADGETKSYSFDFPEESISFSSQIFPTKYRTKLSEIDDVIKKYIKQENKLPGLALPNLNDNDVYKYYREYNDNIELLPISYSRGYLKYIIKNGTDKEISLKGDFILRITKDDQVIFEKKELTKYTSSISPKSSYDSSIKLKDWLQPGFYKLEVNSYSCNFEIK